MTLSKRISYNLRLTGGNVLSDTLNASIGTVNNILSTNISSGDIRISGDLFVGGTLTTVNITSTNLLDTNISSSSIVSSNASITIGTIGSLLNTNVIATNISSGTLNLSTGLTAGTILATTSISSGVLNATNSTVTNSTVTNLVVTSNTVTNVVATNLSSGTLNLSTGITSASAQITNSNVTTETIGTAIVTTNLLATGNSNTVGNIFTTGGNVGIGTTSPSSRLTILTPDPAVNFSLLDFRNPTYGIYAQSDSINARGNTLRFLATDYNTNNVTTRDILTMRPEGNVGIGTASPITKLNVAGDSNSVTTNGVVLITGADYNGHSLHIASSSASYKRLGFNHNGTIRNIFAYDYATGPQNLILQYAGGNVGIGTSSPTVKLNVVGDTIIQSGLLTVKNNGGYGSIELQGITGSYIDFGPDTIDFRTRIMHNEGNRSLTFEVNGGTTAMTLASTGNVGIGTGSPIYKLDVNGGRIYNNTTSVTNGNIILNNNIEGGVIQFSDIHHSIWGRKGYNNETDVLQIREYDQIQFWTGGLIQNQSNRMTVTSTGNVGINTGSPGYKLDVNGSLATNTMLIRSTSYSTTLATQVYNENTWYTAISPGILTSDATYIVSLSFVAGATPWNIYASFLHMIGYTNDNQFLYTSGANVPTTIHANNSNGVDYQIKVRGSYAPNSNSGIQFSIAGTTPSGYWTVKAYRII